MFRVFRACRGYGFGVFRGLGFMVLGFRVSGFGFWVFGVWA